MRVNREWVKWDDEDRSNSDREGGFCPNRIGSDDRNHQLNYCYYYRRRNTLMDKFSYMEFCL